MSPAGRCRRCGGVIAETTEADLRLCHRLAQDAGPLHYPDDEIAQMWAGDAEDLHAWLLRRRSGAEDAP